MINDMLIAPAVTFSPLAASSAPNVFIYFGNSNVAGQLIVMALLVFSLMAWTVMVGKYLDLNRLSMLNRNVERRLAKLDQVFQMNQNRSENSPYGHLVNAALEAHQHFAGTDRDRSTHIGHIENALQRTVARQSIRYESKMVLLGSIVTGAPFLGLLGTVWGVMDAFGGMALQSSATLQNLAPGVSGALLTTVAGLLVAIPSVFGYNFLLTQTKRMVTELENFASSLADRIELELK